MNSESDVGKDYECSVSQVDDLDTETRLCMARLYAQMYDAFSIELFLDDLSDKSEALILRHHGAIVGFTTLKTYARYWRGSPIRVLFSGDTVVDHSHWGQQALSFAWVRHLGTLSTRYKGERLIWFLLTKGHRTYRYLPVFAKSFYPGQSAAGNDLKPLLDLLAHDKFPGEYNFNTGIVEFPVSRGHLKSEVADPRPDELDRPGVMYFLERNPKYRIGHELACICDIAEWNMKPLTLRLYRQGCNGVT